MSHLLNPVNNFLSEEQDPSKQKDAWENIMENLNPGVIKKQNFLLKL